ncbi:MAG TPA: hypothetical protein VGA02_14910 [Gemmatimonadales bacterium]|jgi:hypothetical protein
MPHSTQPTTAAGGKRFGLLLPGVFTVLAASTIAAMVITSDSAPRREATLPAGTVLIAALDRSVSTKESRIGDAVRLETTEPVRLADEAVVPAGAVILGEVTHSQDGGRIAGAPELTLRFTELEADGERYRMDARPFRIRGKNDALESAAQIGGGAVAGGILGGVLGGGGGAVKGAVAGAAIGTGVAIATDGDDLVLPAGVKLKVELAAPLALTYRPATDD